MKKIGIKLFYHFAAPRLQVNKPRFDLHLKEAASVGRSLSENILAQCVEESSAIEFSHLTQALKSSY